MFAIPSLVDVEAGDIDIDIISRSSTRVFFYNESGQNGFSKTLPGSKAIGRRPRVLLIIKALFGGFAEAVLLRGSLSILL